nr:MAG TPA: hypothetical protein [Caudoviricetes sp.]
MGYHCESLYLKVLLVFSCLTGRCSAQTGQISCETLKCGLGTPTLCLTTGITGSTKRTGETGSCTASERAPQLYSTERSIMTTWQQDQIDYPQPLDDYVVIGILQRINTPTRFVGAELELSLAPWETSDPEFVTRILPYEAAESFLVSWNAFEQATAKTVWVETFWKRAKPWRVEMRRREVR